jgi:large subunit ribosomal protein L18
MFKKIDKNKSRQKRHMRLRTKIQGTPDRPRLNVFRSSKHIYAQIIDDATGKTIVSASTVEKGVKADLENTSNIDAAKRIGQLAAERALEKGVSVVVFDRGGFIYHGRVKALAEAAREAGLKF